MRPRTVLLLLAPLLAAGCGADQIANFGPTPVPGLSAAANIGSLVVIGRTPGDLVVSLITGRDCSVARTGRGQTYCADDPAPAQPPFCTRSLGQVDCWTYPPAAYPAYRGVADQASLTEAQEANRTRRWPFGY